MKNTSFLCRMCATPKGSAAVVFGSVILAVATLGSIGHMVDRALVPAQEIAPVKHVAVQFHENTQAAFKSASPTDTAPNSLASVGIVMGLLFGTIGGLNLIHKQKEKLHP